jgi:hypothetical protein
VLVIFVISGYWMLSEKPEIEVFILKIRFFDEPECVFGVRQQNEFGIR